MRGRSWGEGGVGGRVKENGGRVKENGGRVKENGGCECASSGLGCVDFISSVVRKE